MREIGIAGGARLRAMRLHRIHIGAIQQVLVRIRVVSPNALDEFILPHHTKETLLTARAAISGPSGAVTSAAFD